MKAMILAAGFGTRLRPLTYNIPKPLLPIGPDFFLSRILGFLKKNGITEVMINLHYLGEKIKNKIGKGEKWGLRIHYSFEPEILGTAGGMKKAESFLKDDHFLLINSDIVFDLNLAGPLEMHLKNKAYATLVLRKDKDVEKYGVIGVDSRGKIVKFINLYEEAPGKKFTRAMFSGIQVVNPEVFKFITPGKFSETTKTLYPRLLQEGFPLYGYVSKEYWRELGTLEEYLQEANLRLIPKK